MQEFIYTLEEAYKTYPEELVNEQLKIELENASLGRDRFLRKLERNLQTGGSELTSNKTVKPLAEILIDKLEKGIEEEINAPLKGRAKKGLKLIVENDKSVLAYITVSTVFTLLAKGQELKYAKLLSTLQRAIIDELTYSSIRAEEKELFKQFINNGIAKRAGKSYKKLYTKKVLEHNDITVEDYQVDKDLALFTATLLLEILYRTTRVFKIEKSELTQTTTVTLEESYLQAVLDRANELADFEVMYQPLVIKPKAWDTYANCGYYTKSLRSLPFVRVHDPRLLKEIYENVDMPKVYKAVNIAQNTAWKVNTKILDVINALKDDKHPVGGIPAGDLGTPPEKPHDIDTNPKALADWKKRASFYYKNRSSSFSKRLRFESIIQSAGRFSQYEKIYFAYNLDWRGRIYPIGSFNPQSDDIGKALLSFAERKPIGIDGFQWLKIHLANCAGVDKASFEERVKWTEEHKEQILESAKNPTEYLWWSEQDSPFQFLAACFEFLEVTKHGFGYPSGLPIPFDGSCSGNQHFSCMLRDEVGGKAVNLVPSDTVHDIYQLVADEVIKQCEDLVVNGTDNSLETKEDKDGNIFEKRCLGTKELAKRWLDFGITRSVTKRPTMTSCYGAKEFGFKEQVLADTVAPAVQSQADKGLFVEHERELANFMGSQIWEAIKKVSVKSMEAMEWLQDCARLLSREIKKGRDKEIVRERCPIRWITPDGFPVFQKYTKRKEVRINTMFDGSYTRLTLRAGTDEIDPRAMANGIAPNVVHSYDANHLRTIVVYAHDKFGLESFALIHDSFGVHAADSTRLFRTIRETMVEIYENSNVLEDFAEGVKEQLHESQLKDFKEPPKKGNLNLRDILKSKYAFA